MSCQCERSGHRSLATTLLLLATLWPACRGNENRAAAARDGGGDGGGDTAISNRDLAASDGYESGDLTFEVELDGRGDLPGNSVDAEPAIGPDALAARPDVVADFASDPAGGAIDAAPADDQRRDLAVAELPAKDVALDGDRDAPPGPGVDAGSIATFQPGGCTSAYQVIYSSAADELPPSAQNDLAWKDGTVFVARTGYEGYSWIFSMPDRGGSKNLLYEGHVSGWSLDDTRLVYAQTGELFSMPLEGGPPQSLFRYGGRYNSTPSSQNLDSTAMYWLEYPSELKVYRHWRSGGDDALLATIPSNEVSGWFYQWMGQVRDRLVLKLWKDTGSSQAFVLAKTDGARRPLPRPYETSTLLGLSQAGTLLWSTPPNPSQPNGLVPGLARSDLEGATPVHFTTTVPASATALGAWAAGGGGWYLATSERDEQQAVYLSIWYVDAGGQAKRLACDPRAGIPARPETTAKPQGTIAAAVAADGAFYMAVNYAEGIYAYNDWQVARIENPGAGPDPVDDTGIVPDGGIGGDSGPPCPSTTTSVGPYTVSEFPVPTAKTGPDEIALGPDGNVWFSEQDTDHLGKVSPAGCIQEYTPPRSSVGISDLVAGPDGYLWFTSGSDDLIGHIAVDGLLYRLHDTPGALSYPQTITLGPDGNFWFTSSTLATVGRITPAGKYDAFTLPCKVCQTSEVARGSNGLVWFTETSSAKVVAVDAATGAIQEYTVPGVTSFGRMTTGPDGNPWVASSRSGSIYLTRINPDRTFTDFALPAGADYPYALASGPDGTLWMTNSDSNTLSRFSIATGELAAFRLPAAKRGLRELTSAPDGNFWFTEYSTNQIGRLNLK